MHPAVKVPFTRHFANFLPHPNTAAAIREPLFAASYLVVASCKTLIIDTRKNW